MLAIQFGLFACCLAWAFTDPQFGTLAAWFSPHGHADDSLWERIIRARAAGAHLRLTLLIVLGLAVVTISAVHAVGWLVRSPRTYRLRSLMLATLLTALWLGLLSNHSAVCWQGDRMRMRMGLNGLQSLADRLRTHWPESDGELPEAGPFLAYPTGRPRTLILLTPPSLAPWSATISAVDRSDHGVLRFQLTGPGADDWVEWHPDGHRPAPFTGGLEDRHRFERSATLGGGWYLVRYRGDSPQPADPTRAGALARIAPRADRVCDASGVARSASRRAQKTLAVLNAAEPAHSIRSTMTSGLIAIGTEGDLFGPLSPERRNAAVGLRQGPLLN